VIFGVLGPIQVIEDDGVIEIPATKQRTVLAALLLRANRSVPMEMLVETLWRDRLPVTARGTLHTHVMRLRRALGHVAGGRIRTTGSGYAITVGGADELDAIRFARLRERGEAELAEGRWESAARQLGAASELWRGEALADLPLSSWQIDEVARLTEQRWLTTESWITAEQQLGRHEQNIARLRGLVSTHPLRERFHGQLMQSLYATGRKAEAVDVYVKASKVLVEELGVVPGLQLRRIYEAILADDPVTAAGAAAPASAQGAAPTAPAAPAGVAEIPVPRIPAQLPPAVAGFSGRVDQIREVLAHLTAALADDGTDGGPHPGGAMPRVVVLTGPGGIGKSALAAHVGQLLKERFPDGQLFAALNGAGAPVAPAEVLRRFLSALGAPEAGLAGMDPDACQASFRSAVSGRRMLILLDDARDASQVRPLLSGSAGSALVVTSRTRLAELPGSRLVHLAGLGSEESLAMLAELIGAERVAGEPEAAAAVIEACGGLPLAVAAVGARLNARPQWRVADLAERLRESRDMLGELSSGDLAVRPAFASSYEALNERRAAGAPLTETFQLLGLWDGATLGLAAAAALLAAPAEVAERSLEALVDLNLLESPGAGRYRLHPLIQRFAAEMSAAHLPAPRAADGVRRLLTWYVHSVDGANEAARLARRLSEEERDERPPGARRFAGAEEARAWFEGERANFTAALRLGVRFGLDALAWRLLWLLEESYLGAAGPADWAALCEVGTRAAQRSGNHAGIVAMLDTLAGRYGQAGDLESSLICRHTALEICRNQGLAGLEAGTVAGIGFDYLRAGRPREAVAVFGEALQASRALGSRFAEAAILDGLGVAHLESGRVQDAVACLRQSADLQHELAEAKGESVSLEHLGQALAAAGRAREAQRCWRRALELIGADEAVRGTEIGARLDALAALQVDLPPPEAAKCEALCAEHR
jgi:DNA-binding SARP family transcriptional activator